NRAFQARPCMLGSFVTRWALIILTFLVLASGGAALAASQQRRGKPVLRIPILLYHYISANPDAPADVVRTRLSVPPDAFAAQLAYLARAGYTTITLDDLVAILHDGAAPPPKPVVLTFDDGYADFYANAYPLLTQYGDKATIYVISQ